MQKKQLIVVTAICILIAFVTSGAAFYYQTVASELQLDLDAAHKQAVPVKVEVEEAAGVKPKEECQKCVALQATINKLRGEKRALAKRIAKGTVALEEVTKPTTPRRRMTFQERLEDLKQTDPERYAKIKAHFKQVKVRMAKVFTSQKEFITSLEGLEMTPEQLENHEALKDKLARVDELSQLMNSDDPNAGDARREFYMTLHSVRGLLSSERDVAMESLGKSLGYDDEALLQFTNYIKKVNKMTSARTYHEAMRGNRGKQK